MSHIPRTKRPSYLPAQPPKRKAKGRFHGTAQWKATSERTRKDGPLCAVCEAEGIYAPATEVDHIIGFKHRQGAKTHPRNLMPLCKPHHNTKTAMEMRGYLPSFTTTSRGRVPTDTAQVIADVLAGTWEGERERQAEGEGGHDLWII